MIHMTRAVVRKWLESLLHIHDSPRRTAAAYAVGVFWGFSPFYGIHTLLGLLCAFLFNLNRVAVIAGVYTNLPWFVAPYYTLATIGGAAVLGVHLPPGFAHQLGALFGLSVFGHEFWSRLGVLMRPLLWPLTLGSLMGAAALSALAYRISLPFIVAGRTHLHLKHRQDPPSGAS